MSIPYILLHNNGILLNFCSWIFKKALCSTIPLFKAHLKYHEKNT